MACTHTNALRIFKKLAKKKELNLSVKDPNNLDTKWAFFKNFKIKVGFAYSFRIGRALRAGLVLETLY